MFPVRYDPPEFPAFSYRSTKWHKYLQNFFSKRSAGVRSYFGSWLCKRNPDVAWLRVVYVARYNQPKHVPTPPVRYSLWTHYCHADFAREFERTKDAEEELKRFSDAFQEE